MEADIVWNRVLGQGAVNLVANLHARMMVILFLIIVGHRMDAGHRYLDVANEVAGHSIDE